MEVRTENSFVLQIKEYTSFRDPEKALTPSAAASFKYMAPEYRNDFFNPAVSVTSKIDSWSIGAITLECLIGATDYLDEEIEQVQEKDYGSPMTQIVRQLLVGNPERRKFVFDLKLEQALATELKNLQLH